MMTTKTIQRRLESLEKEERFHKQQELRSLGLSRSFAWHIVLAYYLGGFVLDDEKDLCNEQTGDSVYDEDLYPLGLNNLYNMESLSEGGTCKDLDGAIARALKCASRKDYFDILLKPDLKVLRQRFIDAYRRLFAKAGLDFDKAAPDVLFDAFVTMVNQLPDYCLNEFRSYLRERCSHLHIAAGSNLPRELDSGNFLLFA